MRLDCTMEYAERLGVGTSADVLTRMDGLSFCITYMSQNLALRKPFNYLMR